MFSTYAGGAQTHKQTVQLSFDPTTGYHEYRFDYISSSISFYADGQLMKTWTGGLPNNSMKLYVNTWFPTWVEGRKPHADRCLYVDSVRHT